MGETKYLPLLEPYLSLNEEDAQKGWQAEGYSEEEIEFFLKTTNKAFWESLCTEETFERVDALIVEEIKTEKEKSKEAPAPSDAPAILPTEDELTLALGTVAQRVDAFLQRPPSENVPPIRYHGLRDYLTAARKDLFELGFNGALVAGSIPMMVSDFLPLSLVGLSWLLIGGKKTYRAWTQTLDAFRQHEAYLAQIGGAYTHPEPLFRLPLGEILFPPKARSSLDFLELLAHEYTHYSQNSEGWLPKLCQLAFMEGHATGVSYHLLREDQPQRRLLSHEWVTWPLPDFIRISTLLHEAFEYEPSFALSRGTVDAFFFAGMDLPRTLGLTAFLLAEEDEGPDVYAKALRKEWWPGKK